MDADEGNLQCMGGVEQYTLKSSNYGVGFQ